MTFCILLLWTIRTILLLVYIILLEFTSVLKNVYLWNKQHRRKKERKNERKKEGKNNSTLRYECDETFSDECEFAARAEGEWCNHTCQENVFRTSIVRSFISRGAKMRISARETCVRPHFHTRREIKLFTTMQIKI